MTGPFEPLSLARTLFKRDNLTGQRLENTLEIDSRVFGQPNPKILPSAARVEHNLRIKTNGDFVSDLCKLFSGLVDAHANLNAASYDVARTCSFDPKSSSCRISTKTR